MPYVISKGCRDSMDMSCVDVCPVDCIYEGATRLYIHPTECIECGACESACPVSAISFTDQDSPDEDLLINAGFFELTLPGRDKPLGSPGGAMSTGPVGVDLPDDALDMCQVHSERASQCERTT